MGRYIGASILSLTTAFLVFILETGYFLPGGTPLGKLLSPQDGFWQNAESVNQDHSAKVDLGSAGNIQKTCGKIFIDDRLVPHMFGKSSNDVYFMQGYMHAKYRLWQMEFQVLAAAGRLSEIFGAGTNNVVLNNDRMYRRLGMVYAAEKSLAELEADPETKAMCDSYTEGVNAYISSLNRKTLPLEYKIFGYKPEPWSNLKIALFMKNMAYVLCGYETNIENTALRSAIGKEKFDLLFPIHSQQLDPIIPKGTNFANPTINVKEPTKKDSNFFANFSNLGNTNLEKPNPANGSNNWAVSGKKTKSKKPILCGDPHLDLTIPSIWYECQMSCNEFNSYGVSFPGAPGIVIGFNDSCAWSFTNAMRDVRDYYQIQFKDKEKKEYLYNGAFIKPESVRYENFLVKGGADFIDTVVYVKQGPIMYEPSFTGGYNINDKYYAVKWTPHLGGNEIRTFYDLNRAKNYNDYLEAIKNLKSPGQNCVFACKNGDIAIWCQGNFPAYWKGQGDYIMPGTDSSYDWQAMIPQNENPYSLNPARNFVSSANQQPTDNTYPYYYNANFFIYRGISINNKLSAMENITAEDMQKLQTDCEDAVAKAVLPNLLKNLDTINLKTEEKKYIDELKSWNFYTGKNVRAATIFYEWWNKLKTNIYSDELMSKNYNKSANTGREFNKSVYEYSAVENFLNEKNIFTDDINTKETENIKQIVQKSWDSTFTSISNLDKQKKLNWGAYKETYLSHLIPIPQFKPLSSITLNLDGGQNTINCISPSAKGTHGPSWRMIVELTDTINAYGIYPGGQSGNPGSKYYTNTVAKWSKGEYFPLWMMKPNEEKDKRIKWVVEFN